MKREFEDVPIACWLDDRKFGLLQPSICLQANAAGCEFLLRATDELIAQGVPARRKLALLPCGRPKECTAIRLVLSAASDDLRQMSITKDGATAVFEFVDRSITIFREAIVAWRDGGEDFGIGPRWRGRGSKKQDRGAKDLASGEVWFWTPFMDP